MTMQTRRLGPFTVSALGLGCMNLSHAYGQPPSFEVAEQLLLAGVLADIGRARRAGRAVSGFVKVEQAIGRGQAGLLVVAAEAAGDGLAKLRAMGERAGLPLEGLADAEALGGVFGRDQAVYVAISRDNAGGRFIERIASGAARWRGFRNPAAG